MSNIRDAFDAGRDATNFNKLGMLLDPVGQEGDQKRLRALGKWRFVVTRGAVGFGIPMFLWMVLSNLPRDVRSAVALHHTPFQRLLQSWMAALCMNALLGIFVGVLAWRRLTSDVWPGATPDPEAAITRLGSLGPHGQ